MSAVSSPAVRLRGSTANRAMVLVGGLTVALLVAGRLSGAADSASVQTFAILFIAISAEALPFVLLGAFIASLVEVYVSDRTFARFTRLPPGLQLPAAAIGGFAFPVCECGSIPVARRFMRRGMHPSAALAFMLAAPVFNPIVLASTLVAYSPRGLGWQMVGGRAALGLILAMTIGWALGTDKADEFLRARKDDGSGDGDAIHDHHCAPSSEKRNSFVSHFTSDFLFMGKFLVMGAALSAVLQTVVPRDLIAGVARTAILATLVLMLVAFISSLCSQADAFVAVSFSPFPIGSQLAFLVFGPILDFKLAFLYGSTFRKRFVSRLVIVSVPVVLAGSLWFEALMRP